MKVETFEIEDTSHGEMNTLACDAEAIELIEKLGLTGQKSLVNPTTVTRLPYQVMTNEEFKVYKAVCPEACAVKDFDAETIPLRVIQVYAGALELSLFKRVEIWYAKEAKIDKDPFLVGVTSNNNRSWEEKFYLLARWGKELISFDEMKSLAVKKLRDTRRSELAQCKAKLAQLEVEIPHTLDLDKLSNSIYIS